LVVRTAEGDISASFHVKIGLHWDLYWTACCLR